MKKIIIFLVLGCVCVACNRKFVDYATEEVTGVVTNEKGEPLQGIMITKHWDKEPTTDDIYGRRTYSDADGRYCLYEPSLYCTSRQIEFSEFFLSVTDPANVYKSQTLQAQMLYFFYVGAEDAVGQAEVNIVMTKK